MAVPFTKTSKSRKNKRRTHFKLVIPGMIRCQQCGEHKLAHRVCKVCGTYKSREVIKQ